MKHRTLGKTGLQASSLGFGGAEIGYENAPVETVRSLLNAALDAGLNVIDTAAGYLASEELIGQAVSHRRSEFHLFSKCGNSMGSHLPDWQPAQILQSIDRSLQRLRTDRIDLMQLHSCDEQTLRQGDVISALQTARDAGKIRFLGYSGDGVPARYAIDCGAFDTLQTSLSIADQEAIDLLLPAARQREMGVIAKRPLANAAFLRHDPPENPYHQPYWERLQSLDYAFAHRDPATAVKTALLFTLSVPGVHTAIVGTKNPARWSENARLVEAGPLPAEQYEAIRNRWREVSHDQWPGKI